MQILMVGLCQSCYWSSNHTLSSKEAADLVTRLLGQPTPSVLCHLPVGQFWFFKAPSFLKGSVQRPALAWVSAVLQPSALNSPLPVPLSSGLCQQLFKNTNYNLPLSRVTYVLPAISAMRLCEALEGGEKLILCMFVLPTTPSTVLSKACSGSGSLY